MYIHTTSTEVVPMNNCWEWYVFVKLNWWNAWKCIQEQEYNAYREEYYKEWRTAWFVIIWIIVFAIIFACIMVYRESH